MKRIILFAITLASICFYTQSTFAQKSKFGHLNFNELAQMLPGRDSAKTKLEGYAKNLQNQMMAMQQEFETKYSDYQTNVKTYSDLIRSTKEQELQDLQKRIESFKQTAQSDLNNKEAELLKPLLDKADVAIHEIAKENGYIYVFDSSKGGPVLVSPEADDILPLVKKKLGIK